MANKLTKPAVTKYHPGQAASPGLPARCFVTGFSPDSVGQGADSVRYAPMSPAEAYAVYNRNVATASFKTNPRYYWNWSIYCMPAIPPAPYVAGYNYVDMRKGWNAAADSIFNSTGDFTFVFDYDRFPVGVIVGVAPYPSKGTLPSTVTAGVYLRDGVIEVLAAGQVVGTAPYVPSDSPLVTVARRGDTTVVTVGDWRAELLGVPAGQPAQIRTLLFLAGDYIDNPRFLTEVVGKARGAVGFTHSVPDRARARGRVGFRMAKMEARGSAAFMGRASGILDYSARAKGTAGFEGRVLKPGATGQVTLPGLQIYGGLAGAWPVGSARARLPALAVEADGGYNVPTVVGGAVAIPGLLVSGDLKVGAIASGDLMLPGFTSVGADYPYGQATVTLPALQVFGTDPDMPEGNVRMYEGVVAAASMRADGLLYAVINSELGVGSTITFALLLDVAVYDSLLLQDNMSFAATLEVALRSGLRISDQASRGGWPDKNAHYAAVQYATNVLTGAVTRFEGFNFSGFTSVGQHTYGVAPDGLYAIEPNQDPIDAIVEFATIGSESLAVKALQYVYVGLATDGDVYVAARGDDGVERMYRARRNDDTYRTATGKGIRSRQWTVRLELVNATRATLEGVEWIAPATARRWGR